MVTHAKPVQEVYQKAQDLINAEGSACQGCDNIQATNK